MKMMKMEHYILWGKYLEHLRKNPEIKPIRREVQEGVMFTWVEDIDGLGRGFWLSDPQPFCPPLPPTIEEVLDSSGFEDFLENTSKKPGWTYSEI